MTIGALVLGVVAVLVVVALLRRDAPPPTRLGGKVPSVEDLIAAGRKIDAIKLYREHHGVGLKEAKDAVEAMALRLPLP